MESVLLKQEIYYSAPEDFNDPFECKPHFRQPTQDEIKQFLAQSGTLKSVLDKKSKKLAKDIRSQSKDVKKGIHDYLNKFGIFCVATRNDNILMWSHYAKDHQGLCFEFDIPSQGPSNFGVVNEVIYSHEYPLINYLDYFKMSAFLHNGSNADVQGEIASNFVNSAILSKADEWSYEEEFRCIKSPMQGGGKGIHKFDAKNLKGVILGSRSKESFVNKITDMAADYPEDIYVGRCVLSEKNFEIDIVHS